MNAQVIPAKSHREDLEKTKEEGTDIVQKADCISMLKVRSSDGVKAKEGTNT